ncbi:MAG: 30S ribosomal protein S12 methylthiotransferase RimO [Deltaproteobacteria bacterium]|jgi:ribosomal protein S12 methylthiotransferase|nr:30S ribosomal protein S12 methylthiotransferase RimO [Deltaproteobacteria bacterium]
MDNRKIHFVSLGCPKNLVDSEMMLASLSRAGWAITPDPHNADCIVVNTCSFIQPAVEESIDTILKMARQKKEGQCTRLVVAGCFPQRYQKTLIKELPEVDVFLGTGAFDRIAYAAEGKNNDLRMILPFPGQVSPQGNESLRICTTPQYMAYLKIADGCSNHCTYCIIPRLRGQYRSRPMPEILDEARRLAASGVRELILVAQETTSYGMDLADGGTLATLLRELTQISGLIWIRFLYAHPDRIDNDLIDTVAQHDKICSYFDVPVQHISERILKRMGRPHNSRKIIALLDRIRTRIPDAVIRTTLLVGFPGETGNDFDRLVDFVEEVRFDHLGVFVYSDEEDLAAFHLQDKIAEQVSRERREIIMLRQAAISKKLNQKRVGTRLKVVVEGECKEAGILQARAFLQAPDIDGVTYVSKGTARQGEWPDVRIKEASEYDLVGEII